MSQVTPFTRLLSRFRESYCGREVDRHPGHQQYIDPFLVGKQQVGDQASAVVENKLVDAADRVGRVDRLTPLRHQRQDIERLGQSNQRFWWECLDLLTRNRVDVE